MKVFVCCMIIFSLKSYAEDIQFFDIEWCKTEYCIRGKVDKDKDVVLFNSKGETCRGKTGKQYFFSEYKKMDDQNNSFDATKIKLQNCKKGQRYLGATSFQKLKIIESSIVIGKNSKLDNLVRKSNSFKRFLKFNSYNPPYTEKDAKIEKTDKVKFSNFDAYLVFYSLPTPLIGVAG